jgi:hydroxyacylglutathione hydrolase
VVDLRNRTAFAAGHVPGTYGFELSGSFVSNLGWLYAWGAPLTLIGADEEQVSEAQRELVRIGVDRIAGAATGDINALSRDGGLRAYRVADFEELAVVLGQSDIAVLDVRQPHEFDEGHVRGAVNVPLHELADRGDEIPVRAELWVHCATGYRASIAASLLDRADRSAVLIDDEFDNAVKLGICTSD